MSDTLRIDTDYRVLQQNLFDPMHLCQELISPFLSFFHSLRQATTQFDLHSVQKRPKTQTFISYPTDSPTATRLGVCSSLGLSLIRGEWLVAVEMGPRAHFKNDLWAHDPNLIKTHVAKNWKMIIKSGHNLAHAITAQLLLTAQINMIAKTILNHEIWIMSS